MSDDDELHNALRRTEQFAMLLGWNRREQQAIEQLSSLFFKLRLVKHLPLKARLLLIPGLTAPAYPK